MGRKRNILRLSFQFQIGLGSFQTTMTTGRRSRNFRRQSCYFGFLWVPKAKQSTLSIVEKLVIWTMLKSTRIQKTPAEFRVWRSFKLVLGNALHKCGALGGDKRRLENLDNKFKAIVKKNTLFCDRRPGIRASCCSIRHLSFIVVVDKHSGRSTWQLFLLIFEFASLQCMSCDESRKILSSRFITFHHYAFRP